MDIRKIARKITGGNVEELGMSAEYGQDPAMMQTHTELDEYANYDRPPADDVCCGHSKAQPSDRTCPDCGEPLHSALNP